MIPLLEDSDYGGNGNKVQLFPWKVATIAINGTTSSAVDLGGECAYVNVILPSVDSCTWQIQVCNESGGTYVDLTGAVTSTADTGGYADVWSIGGWQFVKFVSSVSQTAERILNVKGWKT